MNTAKTIHIIGAGVAGLGIGWRLRQAGYDVHVYDKGKAGAGASHAAAGMLAAVMEAEPGEDALLPFVLSAQDMWPSFTQELEAASGVRIGYQETGTLFIAGEKDDEGLIEQRYAFLAARGLPVERLSRTELRKKEPYFAPRVSGALFSPHDHQVDNRALTQALLRACQKSGVHLHEHTPVNALTLDGDRITGMDAGGQHIEAGHIILAAGAWSATLPGIPPAAVPPVFPMKGQLLALQMDTRMPLLRHVVWTRHVYLVPRADGRLIIGATMEDKGFDDSLTGGGLLHLLHRTWEVLPGMEELPYIESWTGFRPTSRDDAPILGPSGIKGLTYATGQHRHGILMTPIVADTVARYVSDGVMPNIAGGMTMARFQQPHAA